MRTKKTSDLEKMFSNVALEPSADFKNKLAKKITQPPKGYVRSLKYLFFPLFASLLVVGGFILYGTKTVGEHLSIDQIFEKAYAYEASPNGSFWNVDAKLTFGPKVAACTGSGDGIAPSEDMIGQSVTYNDLLYKDSLVTAIVSNNSAHGIYAVYSEDPDVPAFSDRQLPANNVIDSFVLDYENWTFTDADGNELPKNAKIPSKTDGEYVLYARYNAEDCDTQIQKITVDAKSGMLKSSIRYIGSVQAANIQSEYLQEVTRKDGSFSVFKKLFEEAGLDIERDNVYALGYAMLTINNSEAGYSFAYNKAWLGDYVETTDKNKNGTISLYRYVFSKERSFIYEVRTKHYDGDGFSSVQELRSAAKDNDWIVESDLWSPGILVPGYGKVAGGSLQVRGNGKRMIVIETGSTDIPTVYGEVDERFDAGRDETGSQQIHFWQMNQISVFIPGSATDEY